MSNKVWAKQEGMIAFAGYPLIVQERLVGVVAMFARQSLTDEIEASPNQIIVEKHEGTIEVDSEVGQGTIFTLLLPIAA